jgi:hypothetical protein
MTYFSDFDYNIDIFDDPDARDRIIRHCEDQILEDSFETVPHELFEDF